MVPHLNRLNETVQMRGHNICFYAYLKKLSDTASDTMLLSCRINTGMNDLSFLSCLWLAEARYRYGSSSIFLVKSYDKFSGISLVTVCRQGRHSIIRNSGMDSLTVFTNSVEG